jgi:hypothetical protein
MEDFTVVQYLINNITLINIHFVHFFILLIFSPFVVIHQSKLKTNFLHFFEKQSYRDRVRHKLL